METAIKDSVEKLWWDLCDRFQKQGLECLNVEEAQFFKVCEFRGEVLNGDLEQYLYGSTGRFAAGLPAALEAIGADELGAYVTSVFMSTFGDWPPTDDRGRRQRLSDLAGEAFETFDAFDCAFYETYDDRLVELLAAYAREKLGRN